jgi:long-chain acyl-CoA synthetase
LQALNVLITNPRDISHFIKEIKNLKFSVITGVNTLFNALMNHPKFTDIDFSKVKFAIGGGMAMQRTVAEKWQKITKHPLIEGYGLTEAAPLVCANPLDLKAFNGSIGLPVPSTDVSIRDDLNREVIFNQPGELCVKGPQVMVGYWNSVEETKKAFTEDGWLRTGDIATMDKDGFCYIVDRKKDTIIVSGFNVFPNEVEEVISRHPGVLEAAVIGIPDDAVGEIVKAYIVKKDPKLTSNDITEFCRKYLTRYKIPKSIEFRKDLPKTNVGKILRRELRDQALKELALKDEMLKEKLLREKV